MGPCVRERKSEKKIMYIYISRERQRDREREREWERGRQTLRSAERNISYI